MNTSCSLLIFIKKKKKKETILSRIETYKASQSIDKAKMWILNGPI